MELLPWNPAVSTYLPPSATVSISGLESASESLFWIVSYCPRRCKSCRSLWSYLPFLSSCFLEDLSISKDPRGRERLHSWYLVPFPLQRFKEQLSHSVSSCCLLPLDSTSTSSVPGGAEGPSTFPQGLVPFLLLRDSRNLTWALLFA